MAPVPLPDFILPMMGVLVAVLISILVLVLLFEAMHTRRRDGTQISLSKEDFFGRARSVSSDVDYYYEGLFTKSIELVFREAGDGLGENLAHAQTSIGAFAKLHRLVSLKDMRGALAVKLCGNSGTIVARADKGELKVKLNGADIGRISFTEHSFIDPSGRKIGEFEKMGLAISGSDMLGLPILGRRENFYVSQKVVMRGRDACAVTFRKWPDSAQPLLEKLERKLKNEDVSLIFALAAFEWAVSVNLRE